jgi:hypothetical protein
MAKQPEKKIVTREALDDADLRSSLMSTNIEYDVEGQAVRRDEVAEDKIFGLNPVERMILSIILFITITVLGVALLFITGTIAIR